MDSYSWTSFLSLHKNMVKPSTKTDKLWYNNSDNISKTKFGNSLSRLKRDRVDSATKF